MKYCLILSLLFKFNDMLGRIIISGLLLLFGWPLDALSSTKLQLLISLLVNYCNVLHHLGEQDLILCIINNSHSLQLKR